MDIILYNIGTVIFLLIFGYLIGSIPNAIWIGKLFFHKDPRDYGSGNAGGTNAGRVFGKGVGVIVILFPEYHRGALIYDSFGAVPPVFFSCVIDTISVAQEIMLLLNVPVEKLISASELVPLPC